METINCISIHHTAPNIAVSDKEYESDYLNFVRNLRRIRRRQLIKDIIFVIVFSVAVVFRAYVFLEYGI